MIVCATQPSNLLESGTDKLIYSVPVCIWSKVQIPSSLTMIVDCYTVLLHWQRNIRTSQSLRYAMEPPVIFVFKVLWKGEAELPSWPFGDGNASSYIVNVTIQTKQL